MDIDIFQSVARSGQIHILDIRSVTWSIFLISFSKQISSQKHSMQQGVNSYFIKSLKNLLNADKMLKEKEKGHTNKLINILVDL
jgi:hypothetical protein